MRTAIIISGGLVLLGIALLVGRWMGGMHAMVTAAKIFILVWFALALLNMWLGVARAGYTVAEEFPIFLVIFAIPAAVAVLIWWKWS